MVDHTVVSKINIGRMKKAYDAGNSDVVSTEIKQDTFVKMLNSSVSLALKISWVVLVS